MSNHVLREVVVTAPRGQLGGAVWSGGSGGTNQLVDIVYDDSYLCYFTDCNAIEPAPPPEPIQTTLDEVQVVAPIISTITPSLPSPPLSFQGPLPSPSPSPGGGGGTVTPAPVEAPAPTSPPRRYEVPKAGVFRRLRFTLEEISKALKTIGGNIRASRPATPFSFLAESLLIGPNVADATLYNPRVKQPARPGDELWTMLPEQIVSTRSPTPFNERIESPWTIPSLSPSPAPSPSWLPQPLVISEPESFASPSAMPLPSGNLTPLMSAPSPLSTPAPAPLPTTRTPAPTGDPFQPFTQAPAPAAPAPASPFMPSLDSPSSPSINMFAEPSPLAPTGKNRTCKPCTKGQEEKIRSVCYVKLVKERRNSRNDKSRKWRKIKCQ